MRKNKFIIAFLCTLTLSILHGQDTIVIGFGQSDGVAIVSSSSSGNSNAENTLNQAGFLPNENAASRFLSQATLGYSFDDIMPVTIMGYEDWIDQQITIPIPYTLTDRVKFYHEIARSALNDPEVGTSSGWWDSGWWHYHMTSTDLLRQRVAFALSELLVISENSSFGNRPYAMASYYDIFMKNAFGNYRNILQDVTYHPAMGQYLTFLNNPKSDPSENQFPDENYAREVMQLFTIGTTVLNNDGTFVLDTAGVPVPTYDNLDIIEFSKVFTGLTWGDKDRFGRGYPEEDTSYLIPMVMWDGLRDIEDDYHEAGVKNLLNGFQVPDRIPTDGDADVNDALDNLFSHTNTPPFVCKFLIQRLVTANPAPGYVEDVSNVFINNGQGVRGDMSAVIKAILLHPNAKQCRSSEKVDFGHLREPFVRYIQLNKAFEATTSSGLFRNEMYYINDFIGQKVMSSPSVFNFYQRDYQPIGPVDDNDLVAPVFQITNAQSIAGYINGLYRWVIEDNQADEWDLYSGEPDSTYQDQRQYLPLTNEKLLSDDDNLPKLVDQLNLVLAHGLLSEAATTAIVNAVKELDPAEVEGGDQDEDEEEYRVRLAIYLVMSSPEYLINR